jgi:hypothetical protein
MGDRFNVTGLVIRDGHPHALQVEGIVQPDEIASVLHSWRSMRNRSKPGKSSPLCLACEHEFLPGERMPPAFMLMRKTVRATGALGPVLVTAICCDCAMRPDENLLALVAERYKDETSNGRMLRLSGFAGAA